MASDRLCIQSIMPRLFMCASSSPQAPKAITETPAHASCIYMWVKWSEVKCQWRANGYGVEYGTHFDLWMSMWISVLEDWYNHA